MMPQTGNGGNCLLSGVPKVDGAEPIGGFNSELFPYSRSLGDNVSPDLLRVLSGSAASESPEPDYGKIGAIGSEVQWY